MTATEDATARFLALVNANRPEPRPTPTFPALPASGGGSSYANTALARELDNVRNAYEGSRNHTLNTSVFNIAQLVASGHLDQADVEAQFRQAAHDAGLPAAEALATIRSGLRGGSRHPRQVETSTYEAPMSVIETTLDQILGRTPTPAVETQADDPDEPPSLDASSWYARPVLDRAAQQAAAPEPALLARTDGTHLLYPGKINGLVGESESGKSWVALHAVEQLLKEGRRAAVLDFEDAASTWVSRLRLLGITDEQLTLLRYADPDESLDVVGRAALAEMLADHDPALIVLDGANAAMTLLGLELNDNADATKFNRLVLKPLTQLGAAVLTIDHVPKNSEQRGKGAIGAQAKRAMIDGAQFIVEVTQPFGVGQRGELKLLVDKDRAGYVRGQSGGARFAGKVVIDSIAETSTSMWVEAPHGQDQGDEPWRPTHLMEQVSKLLEDVTDGLSGRNIREEVKGRVEHIRTAVDALVEGGWAERSTRAGRGGGVIFTIAHPYREGDKPPTREVVPSGSNRFREPLPVTGSQSHSPYGVGTSTEPVQDHLPGRTGSGTTSETNEAGR